MYMVLSGLLMGSSVLCVLDRLCWSKQQVAGLTLIGQDTLSFMWSIHREAAGAVQLISLDKEKQILVHNAGDLIPPTIPCNTKQLK